MNRRSFQAARSALARRVFGSEAPAARPFGTGQGSKVHDGARAATTGRLASQGAAILFVRQVVSLVIGFGALIVLTRLIGPTAYGIYAAAFSIYQFVYAVATFGVETFLVTTLADLDDETFDTAFILTMGLAAAAVGATLGAIHFLAGWANLEALVPVGTAMLLAVPLHIAVIVPLSRLLRDLSFPKVAAIELVNQVIFQSVTLLLAFRGFSSWAPVWGWWASTLWLVGAFFYAERRWRPRLRFRADQARRMLSFGAGFSVSIWAWQARGFVTPLLVGRFVGAEAVGVVSVVIRLVEALTFIRVPLGRVSTSYLPKVAHSRALLTQAIERGSQAVIVILVPLSIMFSLSGEHVVSLIFGERWSGIMPLFPFVSAAYLACSLATFQTSLLLVVNRKWTVAGFQLLHLCLMSVALLALLPRFGILGYGLAELLALPAYSVIAWASAAHLETAQLRRLGAWALASLLAVLAPTTNLLLALPLLILLLLPSTLRASAVNARLLRTTLAARRT